jgi:Domain of unknown function (DUF4276)
MKRILPVVEGDGDLQAVPELIRRVLHERQRFDVTVCRPHKRDDLPKVRSRFDDYFRTALLEGCPILWVMDYDCATCADQAKDVKELAARASKLARGAAFEFVFLVQEFESLFLADHETTRQVFDNIDAAHRFPSDAESVRDAKGWISSARPKGFAYKPTQHQQRLASLVDLGRLRSRSPSFVRFESAVDRLISV